MRLTIPDDLRGASLAKAHTWVKSNMAASNPGGSFDYTLADARGNPVSLSDIVTDRDVTEVTIISGARINPSPMQTNMTSYSSAPRIGNSIHKLLGVEDIDSALVYQMYAQEGLFAATQSLTILGLQDEEIGQSHFSPQKAALIQAYSMANVKSNPSDGAPFTQSSLERKSAYNVEKTISDWLQGAYGIEIDEADQEQIFGAAKVSAKFKLSRAQIQEFAKHVLGPYIVSANANKEVLRMINEYHPEEIKDQKTMAQLVAVMPTKAEQYYDGVEDAIVAHPAFMFGLSNKKKLLTKKAIRQLIKQGKEYGKPSRVWRWKPSWLYNTLKRFGLQEFALGMGAIGAQQRIIGGTQDFRGDMSQFLDYDATNTEAKRPFYRVEFLGGMQPSPPPYWPTKVVFATMDGIAESLNDLIDPAGYGFQDVERSVDSLISSVSAGGVIPANFQHGGVNCDRQIVMQLSHTPPNAAEITRMRAALTATPYNQTAYPLNVGGGLPVHANRAAWVASLPAANLANYYELIWNEYINSDEFVDDLNLGDRSRILDGDIVEAFTKYWKDLLNKQSAAAGMSVRDAPKSLLQLLFEINDTAQFKYGYTMSQEDQAFSLALIKGSLLELGRESPAGAFGVFNQITTGFARPGQAAYIQAEKAASYVQAANTAGISEDEKASRLMLAIVTLIDQAIVEQTRHDTRSLARARVHNYAKTQAPWNAHSSAVMQSLLTQVTGHPFAANPAGAPILHADVLPMVDEAVEIWDNNQAAFDGKGVNIALFTKVLNDALGDPESLSQVQGTDDVQQLQKILEALVIDCDMYAKQIMGIMREMLNAIPSITATTGNFDPNSTFITEGQKSLPQIRSHEAQLRSAARLGNQAMVVRVGPQHGAGQIQELVTAIDSRVTKPSNWRDVSSVITNAMNPNHYFQIPAANQFSTAYDNALTNATNAPTIGAVYPNLYDTVRGFYTRLRHFTSLYLNVIMPIQEQALGKAKAEYDYRAVTKELFKVERVLYGKLEAIYGEEFRNAMAGSPAVVGASQSLASIKWGRVWNFAAFGVRVPARVAGRAVGVVPGIGTRALRTEEILPGRLGIRDTTAEEVLTQFDLYLQAMNALALP